MSTDLVSWLRSQLDADEEIARAAESEAPAPWTVDHEESERKDAAYLRDAAGSPQGDSCGCCQTGTLSPAVAAHAALNDPAHVLRTVAAHRAILDRHEPDGTNPTECARCSTITYGIRYPCPDVRDLASIYESRDGFDPSWRADP